MNDETTYDYSDNESMYSETNAYQTFRDNADESLKRVMWVEQQIKTLENQKKNMDFCKICNAELKSIIHAKTHYKAKKHLYNVELLREKLLETFQEKTDLNPVNTPMLNPKDELTCFCKVCDINLVGELLVDNHFNDVNHKRNLETYCDLCQIKTISKEALNEHKTFATHRLKLMQLEAGPQVYVSPKESPKVVSWSCDVCHKSFETEQLLISHNVSFSHTTLKKLKHQYTPDVIDAFCSIVNEQCILCTLCKIRMPSPKDVNGHLNGAKHVRRFKTLLCDVFPKENIIVSEVNIPQHNIYDTESQTTMKEDEIQVEEKEAKQELEANMEIHAENNVFYCYICKMEFDSRSELNAHSLRFPHVELAKLKAETVSLGAPYAEYWVLSDNYFCCTLCNSKFFSTNVPKQHFKGPKHRERLIEWCKEFSTWKCGQVVDPKYFYCKTCDLPLVGTTEAELHYKMKPHLRRVELYCETCNIANSTEEMFDKHNKSALHQENVLKEKEDKINSKTTEDSTKPSQENNSLNILNMIKDQSLINLSSEIALKQKVFIELQELTETLYYSKSIPYDIALEYLRKVNKEVIDLRRKYEKGEIEVNASENTVSGDRKSITDDVNVPNSLETSTSFSENSEVSATTNLEKPEKRSRKKKNTVDIVLENNQASEDILQVTTEKMAGNQVENIIVKEENGETNKEKNIIVKKPTNLKDWLQMIVLRKNELDKFLSKDNIIERDVLTEIEILVRLVDSGGIPLDITLRLLQDCNKKIQQRVGRSKKSG